MNKKEISSSVTEADVLKAKEKWNRHIQRTNTIITASFEEMLNCFQTNISQIEIAKNFGVTRESVRQIYNKYFKAILGGKSGRDIQKSKTEESQKERQSKEEEKLLNSKSFKPIVDTARLAGCEIKAIPLNNKTMGRSNSIFRQKVKVNDVECLIKIVNNTFQPRNSSRIYSVGRYRRTKNTKAKFAIIFCRPKSFPARIFIVPCELIESTFLKSKDKIDVSLYIPTVITSYKNQPKIDWWQYENAWHLIV